MIPDRAKLARLSPQTRVGVTAGDATTPDAPPRPPVAALSDFAYRKGVPGRADRLTGAISGVYREGRQ